MVPPRWHGSPDWQARKGGDFSRAETPLDKARAALEIARLMQDIRITLTTAKGDIDLTVFASQTPLTAANFLNLASRGFYNGTIFHRVIKDFMVQGGDPTGTGRGGPGYTFGDECKKELTFDRKGLLAMANAGPGTNGSQFFITHGPTTWLNGKHTIFGEVTKGQELVDTLPQGLKIDSVTIHDSTDELFAAQADQIAKWNAKLK